MRIGFFAAGRWLGALLLLGTLAGCHSDKMVKSSTAHHAPEPGKAMVVFLRPSGMGGAIQASVFDTGEPDDTFIGIVSTGYKTAYQAAPGHHRFMVVGENADFMEADLDAGKTYYALVRPRMGMWKARFSLLPVHPDASAKYNTKSEDFRAWTAKTEWVDSSPEAEQWYRENKSDLRDKKNDYLKKWAVMEPSDKAVLTLRANDGE